MPKLQCGSAVTLKETPTVESPHPTAKPSEEDQDRLISWLDQQEQPFTVATEAPSRKRKRNSNIQLQDDLFEERLSIRFEVKPFDKWESLKKCDSFTGMCTYVRMGKRVALTISTVGSKSIAVGDYVLVKHDDSEDATFDVAAQWKARVLEVRALGSEYKFIRVVWLNRPEDLEVGWKPFHGENELFPTNQMDVIDGCSVNGAVDVVHWDGSDSTSGTISDVINSKTNCFGFLILIRLRDNTSGGKHTMRQTQRLFLRLERHTSVECMRPPRNDRDQERFPRSISSRPFR